MWSGRGEGYHLSPSPSGHVCYLSAETTQDIRSLLLFDIVKDRIQMWGVDCYELDVHFK